MRVTEVSAYPVSAGSRNLLFVAVGTDEGVWGLGRPGLTGRVEGWRHVRWALPAPDGAFEPARPSGPGVGVDFDREAAARHPPSWARPPHLRRRDGSFTNW